MNETLTKYQIAKIRYAEEEDFLKSEIQKLLLNKNEILNNIYVFRRKKRPKSRLFLVHIGTVKKLLMTKEETIYLLSKHKYFDTSVIGPHCVFKLNDIKEFIKSLN
jgi:hypothetical protein